MSFARAVQASNSIEGYDASLDDVVASVDDEPTLRADEQTRLALSGYRDALTYILQVAQDRTATVDEGLLKSLHFMMLKHRLDKDPGRWRPGEIFVIQESTGERVYEGPPAEQVPRLIAAAIEELEESVAPVLVRAAMAHLNLVMVHPFRDGNGRMARALQTLVLAREQIMAPVFSSIEEYLGQNTQRYYDVLAEVGQAQLEPAERRAPVASLLPDGALPPGEDAASPHRGDRATLRCVLRDRRSSRASRAHHRSARRGRLRLSPDARGIQEDR